MSVEKNGIYIHIPFCRSKCDYCSFYSIPVSAGSPVITDYVAGLKREVRALPGDWYPGEADTVYFGGGTPSMLHPGQVELLISAVKEKFSVSGNAEITLEMNPEDLIPDRVRDYTCSGVNRIVLGVQSLDYGLRGTIGRRGNYDVREKLDLFFNESGFAHCIDLITGIPGQSEASCLDDLKTVAGYRPEHISLYLLSVEGGTPLASRLVPDDDFDELQLKVWGESMDYLAGMGYNHYEISNYSIPGFESLHNSKYWHFIPYAGFGAGAHSFTGSRRYSCNMSVEEYTRSGNAVYTFDERSDSDVVVEFFMTALRDLRGFTAEDFRRITGRAMPHEISVKLEDLGNRGLIALNSGAYSLTRSGLFCANRVIYEITEDYIR